MNSIYKLLQAWANVPFKCPQEFKVHKSVSNTGCINPKTNCHENFEIFVSISHIKARSIKRIGFYNQSLEDVNNLIDNVELEIVNVINEMRQNNQ